MSKANRAKLYQEGIDVVMTTLQAQRLARKGERIYSTRLKDRLELEYKGQYVAIEVESGDYFVSDSATTALQQAEARYPKGKFHLIKIGYPATVSFKLSSRAWRQPRAIRPPQSPTARSVLALLLALVLLGSILPILAELVGLQSL